MGDMAYLDRDRFDQSLGVHDAGYCDCEDECEFSPPLLLLLRREVQDMKRDRDRTFGDELMRFLERRKKMGRAERFFDKWKKI